MKPDDLPLRGLHADFSDSSHFSGSSWAMTGFVVGKGMAQLLLKNYIPQLVVVVVVVQQPIAVPVVVPVVDVDDVDVVVVVVVVPPPPSSSSSD